MITPRSRVGCLTTWLALHFDSAGHLWSVEFAVEGEDAGLVRYNGYGRVVDWALLGRSGRYDNVV